MFGVAHLSCILVHRCLFVLCECFVCWLLVLSVWSVIGYVAIIIDLHDLLCCVVWLSYSVGVCVLVAMFVVGCMMGMVVVVGVVIVLTRWLSLFALWLLCWCYKSCLVYYCCCPQH